MSESKRRPDPRAKQVQPGAAPVARRADRSGATGHPLVTTPGARADRALARRSDEAEAELAVLIDHAVGFGIGWPEIAAKLGVTRQGARQHYQRRHRDGASGQRRVA